MKTCTSVQNRETGLLNLIHNDLGDLKQIMTKGNKTYFITFVDDFSRYVKIYLFRNKYKVDKKFLIYKSKVKN